MLFSEQACGPSYSPCGHCDGDPCFKQSLAPIVVQLVPSDQGTRCSSILLCTLNDLNNAEVLNVFHVNVAVCSESVFLLLPLFLFCPPRIDLMAFDFFSRILSGVIGSSLNK